MESTESQKTETSVVLINGKGIKIMEDKSDTNAIHQPYVNDAEEFSEMLVKRYSLKTPLTQMSVVDFVRIAISQDCKQKLIIRRGNSNTACPTHQSLPDGTLKLYISDERTRCGKTQLLYWYFLRLYNSLPLKSDPIFKFDGNRILDVEVQPFLEDMDENDMAMCYTRLILRKFHQ